VLLSLLFFFVSLDTSQSYPYHWAYSSLKEMETNKPTEKSLIPQLLSFSLRQEIIIERDCVNDPDDEDFVRHETFIS